MRPFFCPRVRLLFTYMRASYLCPEGEHCWTLRNSDDIIGTSKCFQPEERLNYNTVHHIIKEVGPKDVNLLEVLLGSLIKCGVQRCNNTSCLANKARMERVAPTADPTSEWKHLRDWVLVVSSCRSTCSIGHDVLALELEQEIDGHHATGSTNGCTKGPKCLNGFRRTNDAALFCAGVLDELGRCKRWLEAGSVDAFGLVELLSWLPPSSKGGRGRPASIQTLLQFQVLEIPQVREAILRLPDQEICQSRIWKLAEASQRGLCSLPSLMDAISRTKLPSGHLSAHRGCNAQTCLFSDINATRVGQLHQCKSRVCQEIICPNQKINELDNSKTSGVWIVPAGAPRKRSSLFRTFKSDPVLLAEFAEVSEGIPYLAISHVWSDGTGVGLKGVGHVNKCLFDFFGHWATELGCKAIWWDAICIPTDPSQRQKALRRMHQNFAEAKHTLVHDKELASVVWKDDGSPCLALAMSTWFTRGWTALELYASDSVYVLFTDEDGRPILKSLHNEILTSLESYVGRNPFAHTAWIDVSRTIRELQAQEFYSGGATPISRILGTLGPRYTSWSQDKMLIASLMGNLAEIYETSFPGQQHLKVKGADKVDNSQPGLYQAENTKILLKRCLYIEQGCLLHGKVTISSSGPWSWCPLSLFDLTRPKFFERTAFLIDHGDFEGCLEGKWLSTSLQAQDTIHLKPLYTHLTLFARITEAMKDPENHLLLAASSRDMPPWRDRYLLVKALIGTVVDSREYARQAYPDGSVSNEGHLMNKCAYVGTVTCEMDTSILSRMSEQYYIFV